MKTIEERLSALEAALWPPQVAAGGSWEAPTIEIKPTGTHTMPSGWVLMVGGKRVGWWSELNGVRGVTVAAQELREALSTLSAPGAGGVPAHGQGVVCGEHWEGLSGRDVMVNGDTGCPWCHVVALKDQEAAYEKMVVDRDAEIGRLRGERNKCRVEAETHWAALTTLRDDIDVVLVANDFDEGADVDSDHGKRIRDRVFEQEVTIKELRAQVERLKVSRLDLENDAKKAEARAGSCFDDMTKAEATIASMRPVVEAACAWLSTEQNPWSASAQASTRGELAAAVHAYVAYQARTAGGGGE